VLCTSSPGWLLVPGSTLGAQTTAGTDAFLRVDHRRRQGLRGKKSENHMPWLARWVLYAILPRLILPGPVPHSGGYGRFPLPVRCIGLAGVAGRASRSRKGIRPAPFIGAARRPVAWRGRMARSACHFPKNVRARLQGEERRRCSRRVTKAPEAGSPSRNAPREHAGSPAGRAMEKG